jgi:hypothetical protein
VSLTVVTAGESHGPALVAIVSGLPAGLVLDGPSERPDRVEVLDPGAGAVDAVP